MDGKGGAAARGRTTAWRFTRVAIALAMLVFLTASPAQNNKSGQSIQPEQLAALTPGANEYIVEQLPINVVFVGYEAGDGPLQVDVGRFLAGQSQDAFGITMRPLLNGRLVPAYTAAAIDLRIHFADRDFEDALFAKLLEIGEPREPTAYQALYNDDPNSTLTIDNTLDIDAPTVEAWLAEHARELGLDPSEPTVFFLNWFGRDDFEFHVYRKTGEPPTDSGTDLGLADERALIAWGGTPSDPPQRVWFHDLSAGPDNITWNWNLTDADVEGDGLTDYRLPPVWEYAEPGDQTYRRFDDLTGDLAKVLRYVAIDLLFASSPLYPPALTEAVLPESIDVEVTRVTYPGRSNAPLDSAVVVDRLNDVRPWQSYTVTEAVRDYSDRLVDINECWLSGIVDPTGVGTSCFGKRAGGFAVFDMWLHLKDQRLRYVDGHSDHSIPTLVFSVPENERTVPFIAVAEANPHNGNQSFVVTYWTPDLENADFGHTDTVVHEVGHYLGLSHPHDGIDTEFDPATGTVTVRLLRPAGDFHFLWVGGTAATVMSYSRLTTHFSQFDLDRMGRWLTAGYLNQANHVLAEILTSPRAHQVVDDVETADRLAFVGMQLFGIRDYRTAAWYARAAADRLGAAADRLGIPIQPQAGPAQKKAPTPQRFFVSPTGPAGAEYHVPPGPAAYQTEVTLPALEGVDGGARRVPAGPLDQSVALRPAQ